MVFKRLTSISWKRDGLEHPSTHLMEFEDTLEAMGLQVRNFDGQMMNIQGTK